MRFIRRVLSAPSHLATTTAASPFPIRFVIARASDMKRSIPMSSASPAMGKAGNAASVAASVTNPLPVTPAAPLEVSNSKAIRPNCCPIDMGVLVAWAMKMAAIAM